MSTKKHLLPLAVLPLLLLGAGCSSSAPAAPPSTPPANTPPAAQASTTSSAALNIKDTPYWSRAHLVSDGPIDAATQRAMAGFTVQTAAQPDGSKKITLHTTVRGVQDRTYDLKPGQKLYFIEGGMGDDTAGQEYALGDDAAVVTAQDGTIVQ